MVIQSIQKKKKNHNALKPSDKEISVLKNILNDNNTIECLNKRKAYLASRNLTD